MGQRFVAAFSQYKISVKEAEAFKKIVDKNGMPIFVKAVFPPKQPGDPDRRHDGRPIATMLKLVIANKLYSSWSLRPWLVLSAFEIPFEEIVIPLRTPESRSRVLEYSPSGKVPALIDGDVTVWESLAIIEYLAESVSRASRSGRVTVRRAPTRAPFRNEMHCGFSAAAAGCPMHLGARFATPPLTEAAQGQHRPRRRYLVGGPQSLLRVAAFSLRRVLSRRRNVRCRSSRASTRFKFQFARRRARTWTRFLRIPLSLAWRAAALVEPWSIPEYAAGHTVVESFI